MTPKKKAEKGTKIDWQKHVKPLDWVEQSNGWYRFKGENQEDAIYYLQDRFILTLAATERLRAFLADEIAKRKDLPEILAKQESGYYLYDDEGKL